MIRTLVRTGLIALSALAIAAAGALAAAISTTLSKPQPAAAAPEVPESRFQSPLDGPVTVTHPFEPPSDRYSAGHRGADLAGAPGQTVRSAGPGVVTWAGMVGGEPSVTVTHDGGRRTTYVPVVPGVAKGDRVEAGTPIGTLLPGHHDCPVPACLHWGLRAPDGSYLDPLTLIRRPRVRLLPEP